MSAKDLTLLLVASARAYDACAPDSHVAREKVMAEAERTVAEFLKQPILKTPYDAAY